MSTCWLHEHHHYNAHYNAYYHDNYYCYDDNVDDDGALTNARCPNGFSQRACGNRPFVFFIVVCEECGIC